MSKGNVLLGMSRGKLGDLVLTRGAGEQIARARNRHPKNPQTTKQMAQRAALATLVEFFVRGRKNMFKFAFESKKPGESDYNAFVRANMGIVPVQSSKTLKENGAVFGEFIMSQGSLTAPEFKWDDNNTIPSMPCTSLPAGGEDLTIGQLSNALMEQNGLQDGDILTFVAVFAQDCYPQGSLEDAIHHKMLCSKVVPQKWVIRQFTLDSTSTAKASTLGIFNTAETVAEDLEIVLSNNVFGLEGDDDANANMFTIIASRVTPSGVKVSTSAMKLSIGGANGAALGRSDEWKEWVAKNWVEASSLDVAPEDILKGSLSVN